MNLRKKLAALAITVSVAVTATTAFAYWTSSGRGSGSATAGDAPTVSLVGDKPTGMFPGGPAKPLNIKVTNPGPGNAYIASVSVSIGSITNAEGEDASSACAADNFTLVQPEWTARDLTMGEHDAPGASIAMVNDPNHSQDGCKNVIVGLLYDAS